MVSSAYNVLCSCKNLALILCISLFLLLVLVFIAHKFEYRMDDCIGPPTPPPTSTPTPKPTSSPISSDEPTTGPSIVFGAALVVDPGASPSPVAREAQGPAPPETWCLGGCDANEKCVGNQNHPQGVDDKACRPCLSGQTYWPCDGKCHFISVCQTWHCHLIKH